MKRIIGTVTTVGQLQHLLSGYESCLQLKRVKVYIIRKKKGPYKMMIGGGK